MKRSRSVALVMMGAGAVFLSACEEPEIDANIFRTVDECLAQPGANAEMCENSYRAAEQQHAMVANKYTDKAACEADFGEGQCEDAPFETQNGGSIFMPLMMGYMMGSMLGGRSGVAPQPLYRSANDPSTFRTADNKPVARDTGATKVSKAAAGRPTAKRFTTSRGGFGAGARSFGSAAG
jgi:uncharacterized protein YgiB involved in biofilm formation